jgi:DUF971 family protein
MSDDIGSVWPTEIRLEKTKDRLQIAFDDGTAAQLSAELLRVESPSAEKEAVKIISIEAVGNYAIRIGFDDGHSTGIYSWDLLYDYAIRQDALMAAYRARLAGTE